MPFKNAGLALSTVAGLAIAPPADAKTLRWGAPREIAWFHPYSFGETFTLSVLNQVYGGLVAGTLNLGLAILPKATSIFPIGRHAAVTAFLGHSDPNWQSLFVFLLLVGGGVSGLAAWADRAVGQSAGRLVARRAQSEIALIFMESSDVQ